MKLMWNGLKRSRPVAVFISGGGSTLQALLEMQHQIDISLIVTNKIVAVGSLKARRFGKNVLYFSKQMDFMSLHQALIDHRIERIILAGFMKILPLGFVELWRDKIINIHPSLLPHYPGLNSAQKSWNDNAAMGVSLHTVVEQMDAGKIILQQESLDRPKGLTFIEANLFLRRTEQFLLRELTVRYF